MSHVSGTDLFIPVNDALSLPTFTIHPFLRPENRLRWDVRFEPISVKHATLPNLYLTRDQLLEHATSPAMPKLHIMCGILPIDYKWEITATNPSGVTIIDVLEAIHGCLKRQITMDEFEHLAPIQRDRIAITFDSRWRTADIPRMVHDHGVLRQDHLLHHTLFKGLSPSAEDEKGCILTLGRAPPVWRAQ